MKNKKHSFEFKVEVVKAYLNINESLVRTWTKHYKVSGHLGLGKSLTKTKYKKSKQTNY